MAKLRLSERKPVLTEDLETAFADIATHLAHRMRKHGKDSFVSPHEILGILLEETHELEHAIRKNSAPKTYSELMDVAVAAIWGLVSLTIMYEDEDDESSNV